MPDLGILFDIQPEYSLMRVKRKRTVFEVTDYLRRVRNNYLEFVEDGELIRLNADRSKAKIQEEVSIIVTKFMEMYSSSQKFLIS
jgi:thymidylate kinase